MLKAGMFFLVRLMFSISTHPISNGRELIMATLNFELESKRTFFRKGKIANMRNVIAHEYFGVDTELVRRGLSKKHSGANKANR